ncbi:MAG: triple tyrosine motif-containing protein [Pseudomonadota bacterium]
MRRLLQALAGAVAAICLSAAAPAGPAFEPVRHVAWHPEDGAPPNIQGLAQSPDGFLWLASATGLYRFDGLTFDRIPLEGGDGSQSLQIASVAAAPNGDVWVGYDWGGIAVYSRGRLRAVDPGRPNKASVYLTVTRDGAVWARASGGKGNRLIRFKDGRWTDIDEGWNLPLGVNSIAFLVARDGTLYLLNPDGVRRLKPGAGRFEFQPLSLGDGPTIAEDPQGRIWVADQDRLTRIEFGAGFVGPVTPLPHSDLYRRLAFDADGAAWVAGAEDGIRRLLPEQGGDRFRAAESLFGGDDGISSPVTLAMAQDSERNIWVGTLLGVDRFSIRRAVRDAGLSQSYAFDTHAGADGEAYLVSNNRLMRIGPDGPRELATIRSAETLCSDRKQVVVATPFDLFAYADGKLRRIATPERFPDRGSQTIRACAFDAAGRLLLSMAHHPLYRLEAGQWRPVVPLEPTTREGAYGIIPAPDGGMLLVYPQDKIVRLDGDRYETIWSTRQAAIGFIKTAAAGRRCMLFGAQNGMACLSGRTMKILDAAAYPQLTNVTGVVERPDGWTWLTALSGLMRVRTADLDAAFDAPGRPLRFQPFGAEEGLRGETMMMYPRDIIADRFGRLWVFTNKGLVSLDLSKVDGFAPPPRVVIKQLVANGQVFKTERAIVLPVGTRSFEVDYTATTLTDPKGATFRYRLEGVDEAWNEAGDRRQAFYTNLSPGTYRFRVSATSSAGVSSREEATLDVTIKPSFAQTRTFAVACVLLAVLLGTLAYRWRVRSLADRLNDRMQERLDERERIARELHDTLLQGVSGLLLQFQGLASRVSSDARLRNDMETALDRAEDLVVEGRNRVRNLRAAEEPRDLEETLAMAFTQPGLNRPIALRMERAGQPRQVTGSTASELAAIAAEAMGNAIRHGQAREMVVTMTFGARELQVAFQDDGTGIPEEILAAGGRPGHFGLVGMRERAERLQGTLRVSSPATGGARIAVTIPARCAYPSTAAGRRPFGRRPPPPADHPFG